MKTATHKQSRYLSQAIQLEESVNPAIIRSTMVTISIVLFIFIAWASLTNINEVARTPGEVTPQGHIQVVQHLEGGIVKEIKIREGDKVQKGEILMVLDGGGAEDDLKRALSKQVTLAMQEEKLRAFSENRKPDFSSFTRNYSNMAKDQDKFFSGMIEARQEEQKIVENQITQKKRTIATFQSDLKTAQANYVIIKDLYDRRQSLNKKGYVSDVQFLETKQNLNNINGEIAQLQNRISVAQAEMNEFQSRLGSLGAQRLDETYRRLDETMGDKAQNAELIAKLQDRVDRLQIRAPTTGLVKGLNLNTIGAVVQPGQTLMEIVPADQELIVQVKIPPQHIGHLKTGQKVEVKFSSFDFSRYGFVAGTLDRISATTFTGENGERYYQGQIKLAKNYVGENPHNLIMPGMTVMADIVTGKKTVLAYLLKPIQVSMRTAFSER